MLEILRKFVADHTWSAPATTFIVALLASGVLGLVQGDDRTLWAFVAAAYFAFQFARPRKDAGLDLQAAPHGYASGDSTDARP